MNRHESVQPKKTPKLINAAELVNLLAHAGPGSIINVRVHLKDGTVKLGYLKWNDDRANRGPVIVIPNKENPYDEGFIPLGGQTVYNFYPKISSSDPARSVPMILVDKIPPAQKKPINPDTNSMKFEIVEKK